MDQHSDRSTARLAALQRQIRRLESRLVELRILSDRLSLLRLVVFVIGVLVSIVILNSAGGLAFWSEAAAALVAFGLVVRMHRRVQHGIARYVLWRRMKVAHIARIQLDWEHIPASLESAASPDHPFESDLDMTGERSVHRLLNTAVSVEGSTRLRDWLLNTIPDRMVIVRRQAIVSELTPLVSFRDKLALNARLSAKRLNAQWNGELLLNWLSHTLPESISRWLIAILSVLAAGNILLLLLNFIILVPPVLRAVCFLAYAGLYIAHLRDVRDLFGEALALEDSLRSLQGVFQHLETYRYSEHRQLAALCTPFLNTANRPSAHLRRVTGIVAAASVQQNWFLWLLLNALMPWDMLVAYQLNHSRKVLAALLPGWLNTWHELEALSSLANFAYLNPDYTFPDIAAGAKGSPLFKGQALGHPLIPHEQKVCNDFTLGALGEVVIITGSNMAGKSSFLRTLGVNLSLAYAGSVVNARALEVPLFRIFTCIKINDSVTEGFSYFYAEVRRLKALLDALEQKEALPLFFLIDEIFRGTNNRERLIGSRSYIRALVAKNGTGIISTHDLELIKLADELPAVHNFHFREEVVDGRMVFDYKLREGPSPTTNALKIMALEGLPVEMSG